MSITDIELIEHLKKLPPLPAPLQQVLVFLNDSQSNWEKIGKVMLKDPVLAGRVLQIANSSFYGLQRQVKDIEVACSVLGAETLRSLAYTLILLSKFRHGQENSFIDYDLLWRNNLRVACLVKKMARQTGQDPTTAFTAGLFHSLDLIIQDYFFKNILEIRIEKISADHMLQANKKIYRMIDYEYWWLIAVLLEYWHFPEPIVAVFRNTPETSTNEIKTIILTSNRVLLDAEDPANISESVLADANQLFAQSGLPLINFQECVYESEKLYTEMAGWMFS